MLLIRTKFESICAVLFQRRWTPPQVTKELLQRFQIKQCFVLTRVHMFLSVVKGHDYI